MRLIFDYNYNYNIYNDKCDRNENPFEFHHKITCFAGQLASPGYHKCLHRTVESLI